MTNNSTQGDSAKILAFPASSSSAPQQLSQGTLSSLILLLVDELSVVHSSYCCLQDMSISSEVQFETLYPLLDTINKRLSKVVDLAHVCKDCV